MQISSLIIAPAFMAAGNYILLGRIIPVLGTKYSFIHPLSYTIVFVLGDLISLVIQAIGGGQASAAETLEGKYRSSSPSECCADSHDRSQRRSKGHGRRCSFPNG